MNYSVSNYLREPRVKEKDGIMLTTGAPLKFVILQPQDINKIRFSITVLLTKNGIKNDPIIKKLGFGVCFILKMIGRTEP